MKEIELSFNKDNSINKPVLNSFGMHSSLISDSHIEGNPSASSC